MPPTLGYHLVKSTFGQWLPGDERGHWSTAWDAEMGYVGPHQLHQGDPLRKRMAEGRMKHPPTVLTSGMITAVADAMALCVEQSDWRVAAATLEPTHMHLLITYTERDIEKTAKWLGQQTTKAVHRSTPHAGPVWCEGRWLGFGYDEGHWNNLRAYVERHNLRRALAAQPWPWIRP